MKKLLLCASLLAINVIGLPLAQAASPNVAGTWRVTFFLEPGRGTGATQCIVLKSVPGTVSGVPTSGTWTSPSFSGWSGQWIQVGDHVRIVGVTSSLATSASGNIKNANNFGGVSFNHFNKSNAANSSAGSWMAVRVSSCPRANSNGADDPAK